MRIGPSGNSRRFYEEGFKRSEQTPSWLRSMGLDAYEYSLGRGITIPENTARSVGREAKKCDVRMSVHAPYFINCASPAHERREKSVGYLVEAARVADWFQADRVVFHVGSPGRLERQTAFALARRTVERALAALDAEGLGHIALCPETMGRLSQLGTLDEVLSLCEADGRLIPTLDFGHLHTIGLGALNAEADFRAALVRLVDALGFERARRFHAHFSRIEFGPKGEKRHVNFSDPGYGPDFAHLAPVLIEMDLDPVIICESAGAQADDALAMRRAVDEILAKNAKSQDCAPDRDMV